MNIDQILANYRNSIFHQNIYLTKEHEIKHNKIILFDRGKKIILTFEDYFKEFYKVVIFLITFYLIFFKTYLEFFDQPEQIINKILFFVKDFINRIISNSCEDFLSDFQNLFRNEGK